MSAGGSIFSRIERKFHLHSFGRSNPKRALTSFIVSSGGGRIVSSGISFSFKDWNTLKANKVLMIDCTDREKKVAAFKFNSFPDCRHPVLHKKKNTDKKQKGRKNLLF